LSFADLLHVDAALACDTSFLVESRGGVDRSDVEALRALNDDEAGDVRRWEPVREQALLDIHAIYRQRLIRPKDVLAKRQHLARTLLAGWERQRQLLKKSDLALARIVDVDLSPVEPSCESQVVRILLQATDEFDRVFEA